MATLQFEGNHMKIGILPLGRPTFDVPFAEEKLANMLTRLDATKHQIVGPRELLFDEGATKAAIEQLQSASIDYLLLLQVTFTDASMSVATAGAFDVPLAIWAVPEPRLGGRLRLNAFCGLNLASHALSLNKRTFSWLYSDPSDGAEGDLDAMLAGARSAGRLDATPSEAFATAQGAELLARINGKRVARIGEHPVGFDSCAYSASEIEALAGVKVDELDLEDLFEAAEGSSPEETKQVLELAATSVGDLDKVDQLELNKSLQLKVGLEKIQARGNYDAFAIRCWPETFTEYGGAMCGPASMMGEARVPCACEADVYGALTQLILQEVADAAVFLTDLVDMDVEDNTAVVWHCGQAPVSMQDPDAKAAATIHTNRKMPLLYEFPLKPGPVTLLRISQSYNEPKMVLAYGEMLKRPMAFTGTSGVLSFERGMSAVLDDLLASGLEHHMALAYGDHRASLRSVAAAMGLPLVEL